MDARKRLASVTLPLTTPDGGSEPASKKTKTADGAVPKVEYVETYQRSQKILNMPLERHI